MKQCCCGRYAIDEPFISNTTMHEPLGDPGAFCGPVINHELRDVETKYEALATSHSVLLAWTKAALECPSWHWDGDQRAAAEQCVKEAEELIKKEG